MEVQPGFIVFTKNNKKMYFSYTLDSLLFDLYSPKNTQKLNLLLNSNEF